MDELTIFKKALVATDFTVTTSPYENYGESVKKLLVAAGTGILYSSDFGSTFIVCDTSRTGTSMVNFSYVKGVIVATNDEYSTPLYWAGTAGTHFATLSTAAPLCRFSLSHQGFLIMLNEALNKNYMYYVDENTMFTGAWNSFQFPTDRNDEITGGFILNKFLYVSTRYKLFKVLYVGGSPDWSYYEVKDFGFVPNTAKKINISGVGEVIVGLDYGKRLRVFDGTNDQVISDNVEQDNGMTPFCMDNITESALNLCWAENDTKEQIYRLYVPYKSTSINMCLNYNYRAMCFFPYTNQPFDAGIMASDTNNNLYFLTMDANSGRVYCINSGYTDCGTPVDDYDTSEFKFKTNPANSHKIQGLDMYFSNTSSGNIYIEERKNFSNAWNLRKTIVLGSSPSAVLTSQTIDIPETVNVYQYKISSSANTAEPWEMIRADYTFDMQGKGKP